MFRCVFPTITFCYESTSSKQISIFLTNKIYICINIYSWSTIDLLLVHAWSSIFYKFYSIPLRSQVRAANRFPLWIIEKRPFPAIKWTCRWTLEMEMKASSVRADSAIFSKISFLDTSLFSNNNRLVHIRVKNVRHELFELFSTGGTTDLRQSYLCWWSSLFFDSTSPSLVTNLISKGGRGWCLNPQTWPKTLAQPRLRAHPIILQWYKFYGSFLWYPILSFQRFPFVSFFHNRILRGEYKFENKILNEIWIESNLIDD